jgi:hypothetical protein
MLISVNWIFFVEQASGELKNEKHLADKNFNLNLRCFCVDMRNLCSKQFRADYKKP